MYIINRCYDAMTTSSQYKPIADTTMFTGIIHSTGRVTQITPIGGDVRLKISSDGLDFSDIALGDSIAANGVCLTAVALFDNAYSADVSRETLQKTTLHALKVGDAVNLEKAMLPTTRFGGHIVAGHVDGVGMVSVLKRDARSLYAEIVLPNELMRYTAVKGSITVDGISLTTNDVLDVKNAVCLNIIPHTAKLTNIDAWHVGTKVNIEVDILARYLDRLLHPSAKTSEGLMNALQKGGFV